jgi:hypothetical protein
MNSTTDGQAADSANIIREAIKQAGGPNALGRKLGLTGSAITYWGKACAVPLEHLPMLAENSAYTVRQLIDAIADVHPQFRALAGHIGPTRKLRKLAPAVERDAFAKRGRPFDARQIGLIPALRS